MTTAASDVAGFRTEQSLPGSPEVPADIAGEYADWTWELVWQHVPWTLTYRIRHPAHAPRFVKLSRRDVSPTPEAEAERMRWAIRHAPVPVVMSQGSDARVSWLVTLELAGRDATDTAWRGDPERLTRALARGLRRFHSVPVVGCPFDFRLERALRLARDRMDGGLIDPERDFHPEFAHLSVAQAIDRLERARPASERLVVCHGDYCPPNVLLDDWEAVGFLDLGELGVADLWSDLAVGTWSVTWNLGPGYEDIFLEEYGVARDEGRLDYYRLLYDVVS